jgi:hypothetical protein
MSSKKKPLEGLETQIKKHKKLSQKIKKEMLDAIETVRKKKGEHKDE